MSYQNAAQAVQSRGRGEDTMLVHMTPGEVKGLQQLAMANGGSLTINPDTGLPEAGFLKSLLPTLIGAGLVIGTGGAVTPLMAGFGVGGFEALRTGDIGKGLMAGLGAYGGAGLGAAASSAGAASQAAAANAANATANVSPTLASGMQGFQQAGTGLSNIIGTGGTEVTRAVARDAAMEALGGSATSAAMKGTAALAAPLSQPAPMPEVEEVEYNYDGPYKPTKREVTYPGADRDPTDSSEFLYFRDSNPYPGFETATASSNLPPIDPNAPTFAGVPVELATDPERMRQYQDAGYYAEGGATVATAPPEGYVSGQDAEFVYGFQPMSTDLPAVQETARASRGINAVDPVIDAVVQAANTGGGDGYQRDPSLGPNTYNFNKAPSGLASTTPARDFAKEQAERAAAAAAVAAQQSDTRDDSFESSSSYGYDYAMGGKTMDHGGFILDAHTVSEAGNGSSDAGHMALAPIGGEPIKGPGDGTSDSIRANIGGVQEARIAKDESYFSKEDVKRLGGGNYKKGEKKLYALMKKAHESRKKNGRGQASGLDNLIARMA